MDRIPFMRWLGGVIAAAAVCLAGGPAAAGLQLGAGYNHASVEDLDGTSGLDVELAWTSKGEWTGTFGVNGQFYSFDGLEELGLDDLADELDFLDFLGDDILDLDLEGELSAIPVLAFFRLALPLGASPFSIYGEAGAGGVRFGADVSGFGASYEEDAWAFSWALGAGVTWDITANFGLRAGYQWLDFGDVEIEDISLDAPSVHVIKAGAYIRF